MSQEAEFSARAPLGLAALALVALVLGFGAWAVLTRISGAVISTGHLEVQDSNQVVQHPEGGVIDTIFVRDGATVTAGSTLIRLEGADLTSALAATQTRYFEALARRARLEAERDGTDAIRFPETLLTAAKTEPELHEIMMAQQRLHLARQKTMAGLMAQLQQQRLQIMAQIDGITAQTGAVDRQRALLAKERATQSELLQQGLAQSARVLALDREKARLDGLAGALHADRAATAARYAEINQQILSLAARLHEEVERELDEITAREADLDERLRALRDRVARLELRAPVDGVVFGLQVTTPRAVLRPAEPALFIVPQNRPLIIAARVDPSDVDQVYHGQQAVIVFRGVIARNMRQLLATVVQISANTHVDPGSGTSYYRVELALSHDSQSALDPHMVLPGMPVDVFLQTDMRSPLSFLTRPLTDYFTRALRES